jgi:hypothetical protein
MEKKTKDSLVTSDLNTAAACLALGGKLETLRQSEPGRIEMTFSNVPPGAGTAFTNDTKIGCRALLSSQVAIKTAILGALRTIRAHEAGSA